MQTFNPVKIAQFLLQEKLKTAKLVVDATAGNGQDTLFMAANTPENTVVLSFDVQESAIQATQKLLSQHNLLTKVKLYCVSHTDINHYLNKTMIDIAMFNLGYLPGDNHRVVTKTDSTLLAVKQVIEYLNEGGVLSIVAYPGHEEGLQEEQELYKFLAVLPTKNFTVLRSNMLNHVNNPPILYIIEKVKKR